MSPTDTDLEPRLIEMLRAKAAQIPDVTESFDAGLVDLGGRDRSEVTETAPRRRRRPPWQPFAAAASVLVLLVVGAWFATRSSSPSEPGAITGGNAVKVGVATVVIPDGMDLGIVTNADAAKIARARVHTGVGLCTITSDRRQEWMSWTRERNNMGVERWNAELQRTAELRSSLAAWVAQLNRQLVSAPPGSDEARSIVSRRDAAMRQIDALNHQEVALLTGGPERPPVGEGFTPTDSTRTVWRAQATPTEVVQITCPDPATAQQLVDATTLPPSPPTTPERPSGAVNAPASPGG